MPLHNPMSKLKLSASFGPHVQAHDRAAGTPDEREVNPDQSTLNPISPSPGNGRRAFFLMQFLYWKHAILYDIILLMQRVLAMQRQ